MRSSTTATCAIPVPQDGGGRAGGEEDDGFGDDDCGDHDCGNEGESDVHLFVVIALARVRQALSDLGGAVELAAAPAWARTSPSCRMRSSRGRRTLCAGRRPARCRARSWGRSSRSGRWRQQPTLAAHHRCHAPLEQHARLAGGRRRSAPPTTRCGRAARRVAGCGGHLRLRRRAPSTACRARVLARRVATARRRARTPPPRPPRTAARRAAASRAPRPATGLVRAHAGADAGPRQLRAERVYQSRRLQQGVRPQLGDAHAHHHHVRRARRHGVWQPLGLRGLQLGLVRAHASADVGALNCVGRDEPTATRIT